MKTYTLDSKNNGYSDYTVIKYNGEINAHALKASKSISGIAPIIKIVEERELFVDTASYNRLSELQDDTASNINPIKILLDAVNMQIECIKHLIPLNYLVFDREFSFYDLGKDKLVLLIAPIRSSDGEESFKKWAVEVLISANKISKIKNTDSLIRYLHSDRYCLKGLKRKLEQASPEIKDKKDKAYPNNMLKAKGKSEYKFKKYSYPIQKKQIDLKENKEIYPNAIDYLNLKSDAIKTEKREIKFTKIFILFQTIIISAMTLSSYLALDKFKEPTKVVAGIIIIYALIDYIVSKHVFKVFQEKSEKDLDDKKSKLKPKLLLKKQKTKEKKYDNKTIALNFKSQKAPSLIPLLGGEKHTLKSEFMSIGRKRENVDIYIPEPSVGRDHAIIKRLGDQIYIRDNNSLNGSYVNGIKLNGGEYIELKFGDVISFSKIPFKLAQE